MSQRSFDVSKMSTASKILLGAGILYFIDLLLQWQRACIVGFCTGATGWHGIGVINGILVTLIIVMELALLFGITVDVGTVAMRMQIEALLAFGVLVFTILKLIVDNDFISWPAWIGLILAVVIGYGGWMRWQESSVPTGMGGMTGGGTGGGMGGETPPMP